MSEFVNPLTDEKFENETDYIESLLHSWTLVQIQIDNARKREVQLLMQLGALDPAPTNRTGSYKLEGKTLLAKIKKRVNVSYPKGSADVSPLVGLMNDEKFRPILEPMVRVSYDESGKKVEAFLKSTEPFLDADTPESDLARRLTVARVVSPGKPEVKLERIATDDEVEE
jgi:hypothetical protein